MQDNERLKSPRVVERFSEFASKVVRGEISLPASVEGGGPRFDKSGECDSGWDDDFHDFSNDFDNNR